MRNTLDISAVPMLKKMTHLPVIVDPSHAAGIAWMVEPLAMAAVAAGADGLMIEVHNDPRRLRCTDGQAAPRLPVFRQDSGLTVCPQNRGQIGTVLSSFAC